MLQARVFIKKITANRVLQLGLPHYVEIAERRLEDLRL
jgi:hypothetical protein